LPTDLVGDQSSPLAGGNKNGTRHTSGNLKPEFGGTGKYDDDLKTLAVDTRPAVRGDSAPPGAAIAWERLVMNEAIVPPDFVSIAEGVW
jgi:hypothetical protein